MENEKTMEHTEHTAENTPGEAAPQPEENLREVPAGASFGENSADTAQADPSHVGLAPEAGSPAGDTPPAEKAAR